METIIGYDLRSLAADPRWTAAKRARFLLRRDVAAVRSVDPLVWARPPGLPSPSGPRAPEKLWPDLPALLASAHGLDRAGAAVVAITAFEDDEPDADEPDPVGPPDPDGYDLLGFDVADYWLLGGLTNCGYKPEEAAALIPAWAPRLNDWHLFADPGDAEAFADVTSARVPEHAPFYGYGIYRQR